MAELLDDPLLAPFRGQLERRARHARTLAARLAGGRRLSDWAAAHEYYGLHRVRGGWVFREWAPHATGLWLVGDFSGWAVDPRFALARKPGTGDWEGRFPASAIRHGQFYRLEMRWEGGRGERIPAYARRVVQDRATDLFAAQVWEPKPYRWKHPAASAGASAALPLIYEAHVGMASEEGKVASYAEFRDVMLPRIKAAGYNTVQLMAVMEHPYYGSFGYHVSSFFAASSRFGTPEELKSLVDTAHGMGLRVIMDLVHSHAVRNERDGLSLFDGTDYQYFHAGARGWHPAWDSRCFDYGKVEVLHFLLSNCRFWLDEYRFDGFRFDGITSMLYTHHGLGTAFATYDQYFDGAVDGDALAYLTLANQVIHEVRPSAITVAEDVSGMPGCASPVAKGGMGFDYRMAMGEPDYWFRLAEAVPDEDWSVHGIYHALTDRRPEERVVSYVESHDQALVGGKTFFFQLVDREVYFGMRQGQENLAIDRGMALHKMARLATFALNGGAYLNFMGNEFGHPEWIDFPREGNGFSFSHARRQWSLVQNGMLKYEWLANFDRAMLKFSRKYRVLSKTNTVNLWIDQPGKIIAFSKGDLVYVFNFHPTYSPTNFFLPVHSVGEGSYKVIFSTDDIDFGGMDRTSKDYVYNTQFTEGRGLGFEIYIPCRTAIVFRRID